MDVKTFATLLSRELLRRGIPKELAVKHAVSLVRTFDEEDLREIASYTTAEEFEDLSDSLCELIKDKELSNKNTVRTPAVPNPAVQLPKEGENAKTGEFTVPKKTESFVPDGATKEIPIIAGSGAVSVPDGATKEIPLPGAPSANSGLEHMKTKAFNMEMGIEQDQTRSFSSIKTSDISLRTDTASEMTVINIPVESSENGDDAPQEIYLDEEDNAEDEDKKTVLTPRGKAFFWGIAVATSPVTLLISLSVLAVFALGIIAVCAFIAISLLMVCAEAVAGSGLTLVGIIYGAIEIFSGNPGIGIYEIGLGICCGGLALCLGILTFNLAVLGLPYVLKQLLTFEGYCLKRVSPMLERFREECNRL